MIEIRLQKLTLRNFKGIKEFTFEPQGKNANIYGDNATGKTTLFDAFCWLLFDKDSAGKKDFEIKTLVNGEPVHGLNHEVEAVLAVGEKNLTLRKVFFEKWTKKRGQATAEFTGHTTDYFIDEVPVKKGEYEARIAELIDEKVFKLLTSPTYFNEQLHWTERREILLQACGNVSNEEVIASNNTLKDLSKILGDLDIEEHRKVITGKKKAINDELDKIPVRIDEVQKHLPDLTGINPDVLDDDIARGKKALAEKQAELARVENGGEIAEKTKQLRQVEAELMQIKNDFAMAIETQIDKKRDEIQTLRDQMYELHSKANPPIADLAPLEKELQSLRDEWQKVNAQEFSEPDACPTCGQALPAEKIEEARANFYRQKAEKLAEITAAGKEGRAGLEKMKAVNAEAEKQAENARQEIAKLKEQIEQIQSEINQLRSADVKSTPAYIKKLKEKVTLESAIADLKAGCQETVAKLKEQIEIFQLAQSALGEAKQKVNQYNQGQARIAELREQEKKLAREYEKLERELYLCEEFIRAKVNLLEEKINSRFKLARFKMFNTLVNGGIEETAETLYNGVPYSSGLNNGHRIIVGLDIINTLSEYYGFWAPIWIDNRESVTKLPEMKAQVISLIVSEKDKKLNVEVCE